MAPFALALWGATAPFSIALTNVAVVLAWFAGVKTLPRVGYLYSWSHGGVILFFLAALLSALLGMKPAVSLKALSGFWDLSPLFIFPLLPLNSERCRVVLSLFFQIGAVVAMYAIFQFFWGTALNSFQFDPAWRVGTHAKAFFSTKLTYGAHVSTLLALSVAFFFRGQGGAFVARITSAIRCPFAFFPPLFLLGLLASGTRSYFFGMGVALAVYFGFHWRAMDRRLILIGSLLILIPLVVIPPLRERVASSFSLKKNYDRVAMFSASIRAAELFPWFGVGNGNNEELIPPFRTPWRLELKRLAGAGAITGNTVMTEVTHAHNVFIQIFLVYGMVGVIAFGVMMAGFFYDNYLILTSSGWDPFLTALSWGSTLMWVNFLVGGLFEYNFGDSEVVLLMAAIQGLTLALHRAQCQPADPGLEGTTHA